MSEIHVCSVDALPSGEGLRVEAEPAVAVFHVGDAFYAVADMCTHATASMSEGYVDDDATVECPVHAARFCLKSGRALCLPATEALRTFPIVIRDGEVYVDMGADALSEAAE
ncbi:bifunctional 3-phenylpropionate/cinnamic acid dioxygenase ferredoxin subunit [Kaistia dalseonensis]|uniref:3-phenylpropionate/trans-cinnamate dioxygenase ferredoxin subunit n=1 Tax=Kaistia dalseonensis TaxID=410840 RepID=A0ABU0HBH6_9HYPH|nr:3-phenylpropionate/cinnamic acid dioxygenase ferredoxin subunit [Kaistia dalseonensis]MCX5496234.1 bifunctional 3-phenylpropionate/cinnamic acid dioxygenase ferredoxin subunit [Kaistia dalseonensis]MDQ0438851.1 3-phenylpropionate/trans-cinnamate dioxygenase ferredoxin subunit [Kaistia dalseonensis]